MRKFLIAANWKMNSIPEGAFEGSYQSSDQVDVVVLPTSLDLKTCIDAGLLTGAQGSHPEESGPFTGDISVQATADLGCKYALCGHSDRRRDHHESNEFVGELARAALKCGLHPIICVGETLEEHEASQTKEVLEAQLAPLPTNEDITIAYEPVWAISRGDASKDAAGCESVQDIHAFIRSLLPESTSETTNILYGASMKPDNAKELLSQPDIDGGLVGGASLNPDLFAEIVKIAQSLSS